MAPTELRAGYRRVSQEVYSFSSIFERLCYYWDTDFWKEHNLVDPVRFKYRLLFCATALTLLALRNVERSRFIAKTLPRVFDRRVRVSSLLALMAYNDSAYSPESSKVSDGKTSTADRLPAYPAFNIYSRVARDDDRAGPGVRGHRRP